MDELVLLKETDSKITTFCPSEKPDFTMQLPNFESNKNPNETNLMELVLLD